jgi:hypothetical protein
MKRLPGHEGLRGESVGLLQPLMRYHLVRKLSRHGRYDGSVAKALASIEMEYYHCREQADRLRATASGVAQVGGLIEVL